MASVKTVVSSGNPDIDGVLGATRWSSPSLTYGFGTSAFDYVGDYGRTGEPVASVEALNGAQRAAVRAAYAQISSFANLTFTEVSGAKGVLRFGMTDDTVTAHAYMPATMARAATAGSTIAAAGTTLQSRATTRTPRSCTRSGNRWD